MSLFQKSNSKSFLGTGKDREEKENLYDFKETSIKELALIVATELKKSQIDVVLVGGAVVSIYTQNDYESGDLDFISYSSVREIDKVMSSMGFTKKGKSYLSDLTELYVEFPSGPVSVGDELLDKFNEIKEGELALRLFTPTQSIMDRLAAYYFWKDEQGLDQALLILWQNIFTQGKGGLSGNDLGLPSSGT